MIFYVNNNMLFVITRFVTNKVIAVNGHNIIYSNVVIHECVQRISIWSVDTVSKGSVALTSAKWTSNILPR